MTSKELWEETILQRIDELLSDDADSDKDPEEKLRQFCNGLDPIQKDRLTVLLDALESWKFGQYRRIYCGAFRDGHRWRKPEAEKKEKADSEFAEAVMAERIKCLIVRKLSVEDDTVLDEGEAVIESLPEDRKKKLERYLDLLIEQGAEDERNIYKGGLEDGIRLMWRVLSCQPEDGERKDTETLK